jgi:signal transduction histidine kinase
VGETDVSLAELGPNQNQLQIDFIGLGYGSGEVLRYQYKLEGSDPDWSAPSDQRAVNYASLAPGVYRFLVRAINADGTPSASPATISFRVLAPMWQRWWFLALVASMIAAVAVVIHRVRVERLLELERVRMRIATDLHDDIGASLSQMAILTEVIKQQQAVTHPDGIQMLTQVAETSRHLVDTMSDIVWAIDPRRDELSHLIIRIGRFAAAVLGPKGISWDFETPPDEETIKLTPDQRRHVYLILKEAITNIARHSQARSAWLAIRVVDHNLEAKVRDDGCGLDGRGPNDEIRPAGGGHGLENMRARAKELDGQLQVESAPAEGVRVILTVPLK